MDAMTARRCIAPLCAPLGCIGCNCAVPADVYAVLVSRQAETESDDSKKDTARLEWLLHRLSGKEMRRIGIGTSSSGLLWGRVAIDFAMKTTGESP